MPEIKLKHVVSCSSEDNTHKAVNLLSSDLYRKWKSVRPGEKQVSVILQLEKEEQIHSVDIGNEGSAFIEVLVGNSSIKDQDFEVLLVTSSFMSPSESRSNSNLNRVRIFGLQQLVKSTSEKKWDRVKIICTQPYNKNIAYGVAFIKFHSPPDNDTPTATPPKLSKLGQFLVKEESQSSCSNLQPGSLFLTRENKPSAVKGSPKNTTLSYAAAALQTEPSTSSSAHTVSPQAAVSVKRKFEFSKERQDAPPPPAKKHTPTTKPSTQNVQHTHTSTSIKAVSSSQKSPVQKSSVKPRPQRTEPIPFSRIMEGVAFVLSGFQNPFRSELRDKALSMGARYRPDWTPDSTHLICAFSNTPKYSQVKAAGGLIVRKEWVIDCHKRKQKISYKRYLIDGAESSSEEEEEEEEQKHNKKSPQKRQSVSNKSVKDERSDESVEEQDDKRGDDDEGSDMDTEDELRRVEQRREEKVEQEDRGSGGQDVEDDPYGGSTDENTDAEEEDKPIPELPDFLSGKRFYLYGTFPENQRRLLQRYIIAFNGAVEEYMNEKVHFVVTGQGWDDSFEDALMENEKLSFVKPNWIFAINDRQKLLPYQPYTVVP